MICVYHIVVISKGYHIVVISKGYHTYKHVTNKHTSNYKLSLMG